MHFTENKHVSENFQIIFSDHAPPDKTIFKYDELNEREALLLLTVYCTMLSPYTSIDDIEQ